jgi:hypothetical protein
MHPGLVAALGTLTEGADVASALPVRLLAVGEVELRCPPPAGLEAGDSTHNLLALDGGTPAAQVPGVDATTNAVKEEVQSLVRALATRDEKMSAMLEVLRGKLSSPQSPLLELDHWPSPSRSACGESDRSRSGSVPSRPASQASSCPCSPNLRRRNAAGEENGAQGTVGDEARAWIASCGRSAGECAQNGVCSNSGVESEKHVNGDGGTAAERSHLDAVVRVGCEECRDVGGEAEEVADEARVGEAERRRPSRVWLDEKWAKMEAEEAADEVGVGETKSRRPAGVWLNETWAQMERAVQREAKKERDVLLRRAVAVIAHMSLRRRRAQVLHAGSARQLLLHRINAPLYPTLVCPYLAVVQHCH